MDILSKIAEKDRELVVSLFYRVGAWIAHCNEEEGADPKPLEKVERKVLIELFEKMARDITQPFVRVVAAQALSGQKKWPDWRQNLDQVPQECCDVLDLLKENIDETYVRNYSLALFGIAQALAREHYKKQASPVAKDVKNISRLFTKILTCFRDRLRGCESYDVNISLEEKNALKTLKEALHL